MLLRVNPIYTVTRDTWTWAACEILHNFFLQFREKPIIMDTSWQSLKYCKKVLNADYIKIVLFYTLAKYYKPCLVTPYTNNIQLTQKVISLKSEFGKKSTFSEKKTLLSRVIQHPVCIALQTYTCDVFFAQSWKDNRLRLPDNMTSEYRLLPIEWLNMIWRPDSFFKNAKSVTFQTMTIPNHYIWLWKDKTILYMVK